MEGDFSAAQFKASLADSVDDMDADADAAATLGDILYNLGITLFDSGFPAAAVPVLRRAVAVLPDDADSHAALGASLSVLGRYERLAPLLF